MAAIGYFYEPSPGKAKAIALSIYNHDMFYTSELYKDLKAVRVPVLDSYFKDYVGAYRDPRLYY